MEKKLKERLDIPVFHDDQHGTAVVTMAAMLNALKLVDKKIEEVSAVVNGAGAAGTACTELLMALGLKNVVVCDRFGALYEGMPGMTEAQAVLAARTNPEKKQGALAEVVRGRMCFGLFGAQLPHRRDGKKAWLRILLSLPAPTPRRKSFRKRRWLPGPGWWAQAARTTPTRSITYWLFPNIPGCAGRAGKRDQRRDEGGCRPGHCGSHPGKGAAGGQHHPSVFNRDVVPAVAKAVAEAARRTGVARA